MYFALNDALKHYAVLNKIKLIYGIRTYKGIFTIKDSIKSIIIISCTGPRKILRMHYGLCLVMVGRVFSIELEVLLLLC